MNIAIFTDTYLPDLNGVATSSRILHDELVKHGHHVLVVTTELPSGSDYQDDALTVRIPGIDIKKLYGYRASTIYSFDGMKEIREFMPDVIHVQTEFGVGIFGRIVGEILNVPVCYTYHTMWTDYSHYLSRGVKPIDVVMKKIIEKISKIYGNSCAQLIVPSQKTADELSSYGIEKNMNVIGTGLVLDRFSPQHRNEEIIQDIKKTYDLDDHFVILFLGRIAQEKSIDVLIEAMEDIIKEREDALLLIVGGGPSLSTLKDLVKEKGLEDCVIFTGPKDSKLVPQYYHVADAFVSASTSETQGLTYIEAMASGLPVFARYDRNLEDVIKNGENGFFFETKEELIEELVSFDEEDKRISQQALIDSQQFSSEIFYEKILAVYQKAIDSFTYCYKISSISKAKTGYLMTVNEGNQQFLVKLTKQSIEEFQLCEGLDIDRETLDILRDLEQVQDCYNAALKLLSYKDYSSSKLKARLEKKGPYSDEVISHTIAHLEEKKLIDDYEYCYNYIESSLNKGYGFNRAVASLKKEGMSADIINHTLEAFSDELEYDKAIEIIEKLYNANHTRSPNALIANIKSKLFNKGFKTETVDRALDHVEMHFPEEETQALLKQEYERAYRRYHNKYEGQSLKNKIVQFLMRKGYEYSDITSLLEEVWSEDNE
ncbi:1,2-diacylglycerol 3-alpha-glucosyltransferase [Kandleria vitulina]|jgi:1,2-diacylglycerol 3-alpha-glucosyltransferase|uniref:Regulatory protein RecX n=1 Tax=Kandleria vitulina TaxID=1630 RepID=A0A1H2V6T9_9FIRM|nr:RecX family transcriptional regulator [Kandleria vitulina]SDW63980.1 1,2-diacylglycerol 3-alpha-glucosyltransferase [Kandleria vitulina]